MRNFWLRVQGKSKRGQTPVNIPGRDASVKDLYVDALGYGVAIVGMAVGKAVVTGRR